MRDVDALLSKITKLLSLATSSNVHEAASAAAQAQRLIDLHQLEELLAARSQDVDPITTGQDAPLESVARPRTWRMVLASGLAGANSCIAYQWVQGDLTHLCVVGRHQDRLLVASLFQGLARKLEWLSATHGAGKNRAWHDAFRIGAAETVVARLHEDASPAAVGDAAAAPSQHALVLKDRASRRIQVEEFAQQHLSLGKGRGLRVDLHGFHAGQRAAASLPLPQGKKRLTPG